MLFCCLCELLALDARLEERIGVSWGGDGGLGVETRRTMPSKFFGGRMTLLALCGVPAARLGYCKAHVGPESRKGDVIKPKAESRYSLGAVKPR